MYYVILNPPHKISLSTTHITVKDMLAMIACEDDSCSFIPRVRGYAHHVAKLGEMFGHRFHIV